MTRTEEQKERHRIANRAYYYRNNISQKGKPQGYWAQTSKTQYQKAREVATAAKARPCADCGIEYPPIVMEFDHVRGQKEFSIGNHVKSVSRERLVAEIAKCDVVCANCHRLRTLRRKVN